MTKSFNDISIVIPTLGSNKLKLTLNSITNSSIFVKEIIIVIPKNFNFKFDLTPFSSLNIVILITNEGGQVFQRIEGFKIAKGNFILQLDDDIEFNQFFIEEMVKTINSLPNSSALSPLLTNRFNNSVYRTSFNPLTRIFYAIFYLDFFLEEGSVNSFGKSIGITTINKIIKVEWLPGGCVLHRKENLILDNYFPFKSKAFMEDLFHSYYLKSKGTSLYVNSNLFAIIEEPINELHSEKLISDKINELKIRKHYFLLTSLSKYKYFWTCFLDIGITLIKYLYLKKIEK